MKNYNDIAGEQADIKLIVDRVYNIGYNKAYTDRQIEEQFDDDREKAINEAYQNGLNYAWECVQKIWNMIAPTRDKVFGTEPLADILESYSASEAIAKVKEYEEKNAEDEGMYRDFEVGDVVEHSASGNTFRAIVTCVSRNELGTLDISLMYSDGSISKQHVGDTPWRKTGKRADAYLKAALEQVDQ